MLGQAYVELIFKIIITKTQIILNIDVVAIILEKNSLEYLFPLCLRRTSHQIPYSGATPPQDVVDVSQLPTVP